MVDLNNPKNVRLESAKLTLGSNQEIGRENWAKIQYNTKVIDNFSQNVVDSTNNKFVIKESGVYLINAGLIVKSAYWTDMSKIKLRIEKTDNTLLFQSLIRTSEASSITDNGITTTDIIQLNENDEIICECYSDEGCDAIQFTNNGQSQFSITKLF